MMARVVIYLYFVMLGVSYLLDQPMQLAIGP